MKKGIFLLLALLCYPIFSAELLSLDFQQVNEISQLILTLSQEGVEVKKHHDSEFKQIFIDMVDVRADAKVLREFDTSEFSGSSVFVRGYPKQNGKDLRIAIQLRDNVRSVLERRGAQVVLSLENRFGVFSQDQVEKFETYDEKINTEDVSQIHVPKSDALEDILENLTLAGRKKYIGKKITLDVQDVRIEDVLKMIADASGFNIIITDDVKSLAPLTLKLTNIPWDQVLDTILGLGKLAAKKNGVILLVSTLERVTVEKKQQHEAEMANVQQEPLVTKIFSISYATIKEMMEILKEYSTHERGSIALDERTNTLIVKDTAGVIDRMRKIIEVLDTQTPQVLIESKIIEVTESYSKEIGLQQGIGWGYDPVGTTNAGATEVGAQLAAGSEGGPGFSFSTAPSAETTLFGLTIGRFGRMTNLNFNLQLMESESKGKIIATPKVIAQNKKKATISTTDTTSYAVITGSGADAITNYEETEAALTLEVTPQVTNEGSILLEVDMSKTQFGNPPEGLPAGPPEKAGRAVKTNVLVENGATIVIGGIYSYEKRESHAGIPFLKDIPLIGWLFRTPYNPSTKKNEMIIFLTPRIINQEEAGLVGRELDEAEGS